ncbi:MAG: hypothetical protein CL676_11665 [Bdellovibrionaceae bacterium]|nr:hypothetical protein [Pseudobdellovibrionaceae bacterium]|tara:strand:+ start:522 stop:866 length:345 start_codon:yes stop_codon:yes gene_type:complete
MRLIILSLIVFPTLSFADSNEDLSKTLNDAKMVPVVRNGQVVGHAPVELKKGSKMEKLGFKKMDIVKSVNGEEAESPAKAMELYNKQRAGGQAGTATVIRDGKEQTIVLPAKSE